MPPPVGRGIPHLGGEARRGGVLHEAAPVDGQALAGAAGPFEVEPVVLPVMESVPGKAQLPDAGGALHPAQLEFRAPRPAGEIADEPHRSRIRCKLTKNPNVVESGVLRVEC